MKPTAQGHNTKEHQATPEFTSGVCLTPACHILHIQARCLMVVRDYKVLKTKLPITLRQPAWFSETALSNQNPSIIVSQKEALQIKFKRYKFPLSLI